MESITLDARVGFSCLLKLQEVKLGSCSRSPSYSIGFDSTAWLLAADALHVTMAQEVNIRCTLPPCCLVEAYRLHALNESSLRHVVILRS